MSYKFSFLVFLLAIASLAYSAPVKKDFYQIKIYHFKSNEQAAMTDQFLKNVYLPAMHRAGIKNIGVFKPIANDTAVSKLIYVLIPFSSPASWMDIAEKLEKDNVYKNDAKSFNEAAADNAPYERMESILLEAFSGQPNLVLPKDKNIERVFELRSYESPTANLHKKKMAMFNTGGEIEIFNRLGFNPVFYAKGEMQNPRRMMRALAVKLSTGKSITEFQTGIKADRPFAIEKVYLNIPRKDLYQNINERVDRMIENGLVEEVQSLVPFKHLNALQTIGYKEIFSYLEGEGSLNDAVENIKKNTRHFAKRQNTWFNKYF